MTRQPYKRGNEPEMDLPEGKTCNDCHHFERCNGMFGHIVEDEVCDWAPCKFVGKVC